MPALCPVSNAPRRAGGRECPRANGRSWTEIVNVLGVSRQAARQQFAGSVGV